MIFSKHPNRLLWLIFASLLLLGLSQVLWVSRVWNEQKDVLRQETNFLFQQTVMSLQDSLVKRSMTRNGIPVEQAPPLKARLLDRPSGWPGIPPPIRSETRIMLKQEGTEEPATIAASGQTEQIQIIMARSDSQPAILQRGLGRFFLNIQSDSLSKTPGNFMFDIHIEIDTVSSEELTRSYTLALQKAELPDHFQLLINNTPDSIPATKTMTTEPALAGLLRHHFFQAAFYDYHGYLVRKILPYGLFSLFLVCLTSLAFWVIFKHLRQQQKLAQQKNEFISNVTHELKTPLTTVGVALEALNDFEVMRNPEKAREYLHISKLELDRLNLLVDKVLRLSMFDQQALQLHPETLDLSSTTQQVIDAMTLQAKNAGAIIRFESAGPCWVSCDRLHLSGVVYNLLDNALKYRRGTPEITVTLENIRRNGQEFACLKVIDNGMGIAPEFQEQVFDKFFRVPTGDTHNVKGHGLGLSYVAHVARQHGGSIRVDSTPGVGSTFTVEIPAAIHPPVA